LDLLDEGVSLKGISASVFLPLIEMEQATCLLQIKSAAKGSGLFYFQKGVIFDASHKKMKPEMAAIEMLTWEKVEIGFLTLPEKRLEQRIFSDLMTLISESVRRKQDNAAAENEDPSCDGEQDVPVVDLDAESGAAEEPEPPNAEVVIQDDPRVEIEQDLFLEIKPDRNEAVYQKLNRFKEMKGFVSAGLFSPGGELVAKVGKSSLKLEKIGDFVFDIVRKAGKSLKTSGLGDCDAVDVRATGGEHFLIRNYNRGDIEFAVILICSPRADLGLFKHRLGLVAPTFVDDLKAR
jgi:hypothetical protein